MLAPPRRTFICDAVGDRIDPTRTGGIRRSFLADLNRRRQDLKKRVREAILERGILDYAAMNGGRAAKAQAFSNWFATNARATLYAQQGAWVGRYLELAWAKGANAASAKIRVPYTLDLAEAGEQIFVAQQDLAALLSAVEQTAVRTVATLSARGSASRVIVREVNRAIDKILAVRGKALVAHHVVAAHAEATLDVAEDAGIENVRRIPEHVPVRVQHDARTFRDTKARYVRWMTAGDSKVCASCNQMDDEIIKISQARRMIPVHPNCRCAWELVDRPELLEEFQGE